MRYADRIYKVLSDIEETQGMIIKEDDLLENCIGSLSFLMMLMKIEEEFGIEIDEDDLNYETFKTLAHLDDYISKII